MITTQSIQPSDLRAYLDQPSDVEGELARLFRPSASPVIFDVGACEGEDSIRYARRFPQGRVFAFEPLPANQKLLKTNLLKLLARNVELVPLALSDARGEATFHVSSGRPAQEFSGTAWNYGNKSSSLLPPASDEPMHGWIEFKEKIVVTTETLDAFCRERRLQRIDFVHLDVQGAEHLVLAGAANMLPHITALWLEVSEREFYRGQKLRTDIELFLWARGFTLAFEVRRGVEGDQFYVNTRHACTWPYLAARRTQAVFQRARMFAGRAKHALFR